MQITKATREYMSYIGKRGAAKSGGKLTPERAAAIVRMRKWRKVRQPKED